MWNYCISLHLTLLNVVKGVILEFICLYAHPSTSYLKVMVSIWQLCCLDQTRMKLRKHITEICSRRPLNTLRPRQNGRHFPGDIFKWIFLNENVWISIKIWLKFVPRVPISHIPALVQIMAWRQPGDKPLSEPMRVCLLMHICVTRPQWVNALETWVYLNTL